MDLISLQQSVDISYIPRDCPWGTPLQQHLWGITQKVSQSHAAVESQGGPACLIRSWELRRAACRLPKSARTSTNSLTRVCIRLISASLSVVTSTGALIVLVSSALWPYSSPSDDITCFQAQCSTCHNYQRNGWGRKEEMVSRGSAIYATRGDGAGSTGPGGAEESLVG